MKNFLGDFAIGKDLKRFVSIDPEKSLHIHTGIPLRCISKSTDEGAEIP